mmetsp:Transcript_24278/g.39380  ORF Transcript_24278/g.39380 Transcript_24278/m.39380 type:complete len:922 (-) Transcript_24278:1346-4111(-)
MFSGLRARTRSLSSLLSNKSKNSKQGDIPDGEEEHEEKQSELKSEDEEDATDSEEEALTNDLKGDNDDGEDTTEQNGKPPLPETRSRSRSFGAIFRRKSKAKQPADGDDASVSEVESVASSTTSARARSRSLTRMFRRTPKPEKRAPSDNASVSETESVVSAGSVTRTRTRSLTRMFRRTPKAKKGDSDAASETESVNSKDSTAKPRERKRSFSTPLKLLRKRSSSNMSEDTAITTSSKGKRQFPKLRLGRKKSSANSLLDGDLDDVKQTTSVTSSDIGETDEKEAEKTTKTKAKKLNVGAWIGKKMNPRSAFNLKKLNRKSSKNDIEIKTDPSEAEDKERNLLLTKYKAFFTPEEFDTIIDVNVGEDPYGTLRQFVGNDENPVLLAKLSEMVKTREDLLCSLATLRSACEDDRLMMLYKLHNLDDDEEGISRANLAQVIRQVLKRVAPAKLDLSKQEAEILEEGSKAVIPTYRLEAFYGMYAPDKLTRIATILCKYKGREDVLWKKLEKQYTGRTVPLTSEILPLLVLDAKVEELVNEAFGNIDGSSKLSFCEFVSWTKRLTESKGGTSKVDSDLEKFDEDVPWRSILDKDFVPEEQYLHGWLRFATRKDTSGESGKLRLSELKWRRRWCSLRVDEKGATTLNVGKGETTPPELVLLLTKPNIVIDTIFRATHKHKWTLCVDNDIFLQVSRASHDSFSDWTNAVRFGTHMHQVLKEEETGRDESEHDDESTDEEPEGEVAVRIRAFYARENPEKLESLPGILEKYKGKEDKLFRQIQKQYPNAHVPQYHEALSWLEACKSPSSQLEATNQSMLSDRSGSIIDSEAEYRDQVDHHLEDDQVDYLNTSADYTLGDSDSGDDTHSNGTSVLDSQCNNSQDDILVGNRHTNAQEIIEDDDEEEEGSPRSRGNDMQEMDILSDYD